MNNESTAMSEWYTCPRCGATRENQCACPNYECADYNHHPAMNITDAISTQATAIPSPYATSNPADAVALLNERLAAEADAFTHATGLKLAAVKVKRDKESDDYRLECHVRS